MDQFAEAFLCVLSILLIGDWYYYPGGTKKSGTYILSGSEVIMEVDMRSSEAEKRTLHFFINGTQQNVYFNKLPSQVKFAVR